MENETKYTEEAIYIYIIHQIYSNLYIIIHRIYIYMPNEGGGDEGSFLGFGTLVKDP